MPVDHYENFPVASYLMPARLRGPIATIYRFARQADDIADEGDLPAEERRARLRAYDLQIERIALGRPVEPEPEGDLFEALGAVIGHFGLAPQLFRDLLSAFTQDTEKRRYADFASVLDYCRRSANPVGRLMLGLYRAETPTHLIWSDRICTALQLINFWQDVAVDLQKDRVYLPEAELADHGLSVAALPDAVGSERYRGLMRFQCERARAIMLEGAPLAQALPGRIGLELRFVVQGGLRILDKIEAVDFDVFARRPVLSKADAPLLAWRALRMRA